MNVGWENEEDLSSKFWFELWRCSNGNFPKNSTPKNAEWKTENSSLKLREIHGKLTLEIARKLSLALEKSIGKGTEKT